MENLKMYADSLLDELGNDEGFANKVTNFQERILKVNKYLVEVASLRKKANTLSETERIQLDLCQLYAVNTLYFIYLKLQGIDTTNHPIKGELMRVCDAMKQHKLVRAKPHPRIDLAVAERFVRSGLWDPAHHDTHQPSKRIKFND